MKLLRDLFKRIFTRQKQQPEKQPVPRQEPQKKSSSFMGHRSKKPGTWLTTLMQIDRTKKKKIKKRRAKNKMDRKSRQINRRVAA